MQITDHTSSPFSFFHTFNKNSKISHQQKKFAGIFVDVVKFTLFYFCLQLFFHFFKHRNVQTSRKSTIATINSDDLAITKCLIFAVLLFHCSSLSSFLMRRRNRKKGIKLHQQWICEASSLKVRRHFLCFVWLSLKKEKKDKKWIMYKLLGGLKEYFKLQEIQTDNAVFRLHNVFTTVLLLTCSLVITATQYVGNPISCIVSGIPTHVVNTFCWISSTFTMPDAYKRQVNT